MKSKEDIINTLKQYPTAKLFSLSENGKRIWKGTGGHGICFPDRLISSLIKTGHLENKNGLLQLRQGI